MKSGRGNQEYEEYEEDDANSKKDGPSSNAAVADTRGKSSDRANVMRSKHSVTEQRRRSKINERFQILRDLIPDSEQKRDTASFLLEVIDYVKYLQEKVDKYEGSYPEWRSEPTKLLPWRNSHWRSPSFVTQPHLRNSNGSGSVPTVSGKFEENNIMTVQQNTVDLADKSMDRHNSVPDSAGSDDVAAHHLKRPGLDSQSTMECPVTSNILTQQEDLTVEGGRISISSAYSQGLLNTLTEALQCAGVDLSQASISVQIDLGKRPAETFMDHDGPPPHNGEEDSSNQTKKRQKT